MLGFPTKEEIISAIADEVETRIDSAVLQPLLDELDKQVHQLEKNVSKEVKSEVKNRKS